MPWKNAYQFSEASPRVYTYLDLMRADVDLPGPDDGPELAVMLGTADPYDLAEGGFYFWNGTSTAADDGAATIKPTAIDASDPGRWIRFLNVNAT